MNFPGSLSGLKRVCVLGAESTGTTTVTKLLAEHFRTVWVPEYGRLYTEIRAPKTKWRSEEFIHIALQQQEEEDKLAPLAHRVLFCDTDALATCVWHERYLGTWPEQVEQIANRRRYDLYLLTDCDIPFVPDKVRDGEHIRGWMTNRFRQELEKRDYNWVMLTGNIENRMKRGIMAVEDLLRPQPQPLRK